LSDKCGYISAEGTLPVGMALPLFRVSPKTKQYLSVRLTNYLWSSFTRIHAPRWPYPSKVRGGDEDTVVIEKEEGASKEGGERYCSGFEGGEPCVALAIMTQKR
jgi:hypothetical protein